MKKILLSMLGIMAVGLTVLPAMAGNDDPLAPYPAARNMICNDFPRVGTLYENLAGNDGVFHDYVVRGVFDDPHQTRYHFDVFPASGGVVQGAVDIYCR